ncbi:MAG: hypothetical protein ABIG84_07435 [archaeon]
MAKKTSRGTRAVRAAKTPSSAHESDNAPVVRREIFNMETLNILLSAIILVVLLYSLSGGVGSQDNTLKAPSTAPASNAPAFTSDVAACETFCTNNPQQPGSKFAGVADNGHCLCEITLDSIPIYAQNKTMTATLMIDQGIIIKEVTLEDGIVQQASVPFAQ